MDEKEKQQWDRFFSFIDDVVGDSPHAGDDETMDWYYTMIGKLKTIVKPSILYTLTSDEFFVSFFPIPLALHTALKKSKYITDIQNALDKNLISEKIIEDFALNLLKELRLGEEFKYDLTIAAIAIILEPRKNCCYFLQNLAALNSTELPMSIKVAQECLMSINEISTVRITNEHARQLLK